MTDYIRILADEDTESTIIIFETEYPHMNISDCRDWIKALKTIVSYPMISAFFRPT